MSGKKLSVWRIRVCSECGARQNIGQLWHWHGPPEGPGEQRFPVEEVEVIPVTQLAKVEAEARKLQTELERVTRNGFLRDGGSLIEISQPLLDELDRKWSRPVEVALKDGELIFRLAAEEQH